MRSPEQYVDSLEGEYHISSVIVQFKQDVHCQVKSGINDIEGAEIRGVDDDQGKMVVVVEHETERGMVSIIDQLKAISGVVNVSLVYHQVDDEQD
ncbi:chaperone NapD [Litoribrevibacter albus]|uniref:Chaperone NapD n=1 Tax=Litoribrevibacter albus TaxID=1473156 RepID=A0AA37S7X5_9GAMM|nr:chaperone NapD [Litoribrevibacter albus]GLQ29824.1 sorbose reductase [Litoribrevibacter albus]